MKFNNLLKLSLGVFFSLPISLFFGNEMLANHFSEKIDYELYQENLLACGGGGGGGGGGGQKPGAMKTKKLTTKLNFKKRQLSKKAANGENTSALAAEIKKLEMELAEID